jgi:Flp pilus assembly protein TadG
MEALRKAVEQPIRSRPAFLGDARGIAAVEFALILPAMLLIYLALVELSRGVRAARQVDLAAHVVADLTGQLQHDAPAGHNRGSNPGQAAINDSNLEAIFAAGKAMLAPFDPASLMITISEVNISLQNGAYRAAVNWTVSNTRGGALRNDPAYGCSGALPPTSYLGASDAAPPMSLTTIPTAYTNASNNPALGPIIVVDVEYIYMPATTVFASLLGSNGSGGMFRDRGFVMRRTAYGTVRNQYATASPYTFLYNHIQDNASAAYGQSCLPWSGIVPEPY